MLLGATLTAWAIEHRKAANEIAECRHKSWFLRTDRGMEPTDAEKKRQAAAQRLSRMTDDELDSYLAPCVADGQRNNVDYEPCLVEMARRGLDDRLQKYYDAMMENDRTQDGIPTFPHNLELLTALRRAQGRSDPLTLELVLNSRPAWRGNYSGPCVQAIVKNVDVGEEAVFFADGGDDRGGRRDKWRIALIDEQGRQVPDSNYAPMMGGGVYGFGPLKHGETGDRFNFLELTKYVSPPTSGRYCLQVFYHNWNAIADQRDISGCIVSKSEPILVTVNNPSPPAAEQRRRDSLRPLTVLAACALLTVISVVSTTCVSAVPIQSGWKRFRISLRDFLWSGTIVSLAIGMWLDQRQQSKLIFDVRPDAAAEWSIRVADESQ